MEARNRKQWNSCSLSYRVDLVLWSSGPEFGEVVVKPVNDVELQLTISNLKSGMFMGHVFVS